MADEKTQVSPSQAKDAETLQDKQLPYPKSVFLIIATEFCERFSYYGMRTVLSLYFKFLGYTEATATVLFHAFVSLCYFSPIFGATIADSHLGKFRTIFYLCIVYIIGEAVLTLGSVGDDTDGNQGIHGMPAAAVSFIGLFFIAFGTGGIKPCVAPFGAEQFVLPQQEGQMKKFFSWFYASINSGAMISTILTPYLRNTPCLGQETCFPLAFGVPAALMVVALIFFVAGKVFHLYKHNMPEENIIAKTVNCVFHGISEWWRRRHNEKHPSTLDYARGKYGDSFVDDVVALKGVIWVFLPVPVFWSLFDQQGSSWTFQATRMKSRIGESFELLPDTIQVANAALILFFIPIFEYIIYPLFAKCNLLRTPIPRMVVGGCLAGLAFTISGFIELKLQGNYPVLPEPNSLENVVTFYNGLSSNCGPIKFVIRDEARNEETIELTFDNPYQQGFRKNVPMTVDATSVVCQNRTVNFKTTIIPIFEPVVDPKEEEIDPARTILFTVDADTGEGVIYPGEKADKFDKPSDGFPFVKLFWNLQIEDSAKLEMIKGDDSGEVVGTVIINPVETRSLKKEEKTLLNGTNYIGDVAPFGLKGLGKFFLRLTVDKDFIDLGEDGNFDFFYGGNYEIFVQYSKQYQDRIKNVALFEITKANDLHMLWQLPQYIVLTAGEIMFSITTLSFSFTEAPETMKAVMMAVQNLTVAFGDILVIILIPALEALLNNQAYTFFFFAGLMFLDMLVMAIMTKNYHYKDKTNRELSGK